MARPRKKRTFRPIVVNDRRFRWTHEKLRNACVVVLEQETSDRGRRLIVERWTEAWPETDGPILDLPSAIVEAWKRAEGLGAREEATPGFIAEVIRFALDHGWAPEESHQDFIIRYYGGGIGIVGPDAESRTPRDGQ